MDGDRKDDGITVPLLLMLLFFVIALIVWLVVAAWAESKQMVFI